MLAFTYGDATATWTCWKSTFCFVSVALACTTLIGSPLVLSEVRIAEPGLTPEAPLVPRLSTHGEAQPAHLRPPCARGRLARLPWGDGMCGVQRGVARRQLDYHAVGLQGAAEVADHIGEPSNGWLRCGTYRDREISRGHGVVPEEDVAAPPPEGTATARSSGPRGCSFSATRFTCAMRSQVPQQLPAGSSAPPPRQVPQPDYHRRWWSTSDGRGVVAGTQARAPKARAGRAPHHRRTHARTRSRCPSGRSTAIYRCHLCAECSKTWIYLTWRPTGAGISGSRSGMSWAMSIE